MQLDAALVLLLVQVPARTHIHSTVLLVTKLVGTTAAKEKKNGVYASLAGQAAIQRIFVSFHVSWCPQADSCNG